MNKIFLKPGKERSVFRYHPWIFSGAIERGEGSLQEGDLVKVYSHDHQYLATGHCQIGSIAVRILTFEEMRRLGLYQIHQRSFFSRLTPVFYPVQYRGISLHRVFFPYTFQTVACGNRHGWLF